MKSKVYTATELREAANVVDDVSVNDYGEYFYEKDDKFNPDIVRDMLRQAADALEREEKRKKYEYAEKKSDGRVVHIHDDKIEDVMMLYDGSTKVRREVGEWEEVQNEKL